jgi:limonene-1,2-epoxide hydrolase
MILRLFLPALVLAAPGHAEVGHPATHEEVKLEQSQEHNIAVVKAMIAAWEARDADAITEMFTEDGVLHSMMIEPIVGRDAIRPRMKFLVDNATHMHLDVRNWAVTGNTVFIERQDEFTFKGHEGKVPVVGVLVIEGDRVKEWREYYDRAELLEAMGVEGDF